MEYVAQKAPPHSRSGTSTTPLAICPSAGKMSTAAGPAVAAEAAGTAREQAVAGKIEPARMMGHALFAALSAHAAARSARISCRRCTAIVGTRWLNLLDSPRSGARSGAGARRRGRSYFAFIDASFQI
eukprot:6207033-Pleurochrysis_carterae.AAC.2